jgi:hypothetical protein
MSAIATDWTDTLPSFDIGQVKPIFDELAAHRQDAARELHGNRRLVRRADSRAMLDLRRTQDCIAAIGRLPEPGESLHMVCNGAYSLFHHVPAILELVAPATIKYLGVVTLGFSRENLERLIELLDAGRIERHDFLYSVYFKSNEKEICARLTHELGQRGQRVLSMRTHAKLLLLETTNSGNFVVESSANLRSCKNIEQAVFTNDAALLQFHRKWINELFTEGQQ